MKTSEEFSCYTHVLKTFNGFDLHVAKNSATYF